MRYLYKGINEIYVEKYNRYMYKSINEIYVAKYNEIYVEQY